MGSAASKQQRRANERKTELLLQWREAATNGGQSAVEQWLSKLDRKDYLTMIAAQNVFDLYSDNDSGTHYHILIEARWCECRIEARYLQIYDPKTVPHRFRNPRCGFRRYNPIILWNGNVVAQESSGDLCCDLCKKLFHIAASLFATSNLGTIGLRHTIS